MAKRKLSVEQRTKLRLELAEGVKAGTRTPELLEVVAKKYGITTITARWYLKSIGVKPKRRGKGKGKRLGRPAGSKSGFPKIIDGLHAKAQEMKGLAKKAQRLLPKWQNLLKRESVLKRLIKKAQRQLQRVSTRTKSIGEKITSLVGR